MMEQSIGESVDYEITLLRSSNRIDFFQEEGNSMPEFRCLSIDQPYAYLIAMDEKTIEVRSWRTHHRGPLVIAATARKWSADLENGSRITLPGGLPPHFKKVVRRTDQSPFTSCSRIASLGKRVDTPNRFDLSEPARSSSRAGCGVAYRAWCEVFVPMRSRQLSDRGMCSHGELP
jgi:hypothetical protein